MILIFMTHCIFYFAELGNNQHGRFDREADIARHEGVRGQLRRKNIRCHPPVGVSDRGRQCAKSNYIDGHMQ